MRRKPLIAIIGAGQGAESAVADARRLGRLAAQRGWVVMTGGRNAGVMAAANIGAKEANGLTVGILSNRETDVSPAVDLAIITDLGEARNNIIVLSADVVVACGVDDPGTVSEVALALKAGNPVVLLGADAAAREFFGGLGGEDIQSSATPEQAIETVEKILLTKI